MLALVALAAGWVAGCGKGSGAATTLVNVSYDPTRELYQEINAAFKRSWEAAGHGAIEVQQSHGGSGKQARTVIDGMPADVVTLALAYDIDVIAAKRQLLAADWQKRLPHNSAPFASTIVFLVRKGNPKAIRDWDDLVRDKIQVITPNPQTSGGARWNYLAAWGYVLKKELGDLKLVNDPAAAPRVAAAEEKAREFLRKLFRNVPVLDTGARGSTNTFAQRGIGDVLLAWENEALLQVGQPGGDKFEVVVPSISILAEPPVAVLDALVDKRGTRQAAEAYLKFLYTAEGQEIGVRHHYRPSLPEVALRHADHFRKVELFGIDAVFGGWQQAQRKHFDDGGMFDRIYQP